MKPASGAPLSILMVEDSQSLVLIYQAYLQQAGYDVRAVSTLAAAREAVLAAPPKLVLLDVELPDGSGLDLLAEIRSVRSPPEVIIMTVHGSNDVAVEAIHGGAFDFLSKPFDSARLLVTVNNARDHIELNRRLAALSRPERERFGPIIGASAPMQSIYRIIESVAPSKASVFIVGESGTGKELAAEALHRHSQRADQPFLALNCAAIPSDLVESELFGHVKGAFTGATAARTGIASEADGGTLFLDELCEMDLEMQKKLLRFIQTGTFQRVGSSKLERVDIRFVCATNRDPHREVEEGRFREDLFYRLHVVPVELPPLRERGDDVLLIARAFLTEFSDRYGKDFAGFDQAVEERLLEHSWPGNVRELRNLIERIVVLHSGDLVTPRMLPERLDHGPEAGIAPSVAPPSGMAPAAFGDPTLARPAVASIRPLAEVEREAIEHAIAACEGNVAQAAALLEVAPSTLYRKRQAWQRA